MGTDTPGAPVVKDAAALAPSAIVIGDLRFVPMIGQQEIADAVERVAEAIAGQFAGANPLLVCVLAGAALFHADLIRRLPFPLEVDFIRVSSYNGGLASGGEINFLTQPGTQSAGRNVILVEDIVDTGRTSQRLRGYYREAGAASVHVAALLYKPDADLIGERPEFAGFEIPDRFVVGYGLDYQQQGRNLPSVYVLAGDTPATD